MSLPSESDATGANTELTLALPGESRVTSAKPSTKRSFSDAADPPEDGDSAVTNPPPRKAQVVGWPPVRGGGIKRETGKCKYVKVAVDGAPYLRKVDLEMYGSYEQLLNALMKLFHFGSEYFPTFQDKDGDWMMVGDVPWNMFVESCKRLRLMKRSEAVGLGQKTSSKCSSSGEEM